MVMGDAPLRLAFNLLEVAESARVPLERLDPPRRAAVLMAILGLVLTGLALVACVMIGGRWVRRLARHRHGRTAYASHVENRRLREALGSIASECKSAETMIAKRPSDDTVAGG
jgi:hypothetical protein